MGYDFFDDRGKLLVHEVAEYLLSEMRVITTYENEEMFMYNDATGVYENPAETRIKEIIRSMVGEVSRHEQNEIIEHMRNKTYVHMEQINSVREMVVCENGIINLTDLSFTDAFSPELLSTSRIPVKYDPDADCPAIRRFLGQVLHEEDVPVIQEMFGYCLLRDYPFHKAFMFVGTGANGKSTLLGLLERFLGKENVASVSLQELAYNRFAPARLFGRLANIYPDIPNTRLKFTGRFKMATGQDVMPYEKKHRDATTFRNYAKLCFSANQLPQSDDTTEAFFRRWIIIDFPNVFAGEERDPQMVEKLTTEQELSGCLNWALAGLKRLLENGHFSYSKTQAQVKQEYIKMSDSLRAFALAHCRREPKEHITKADFYDTYVSYCDEGALEVKSKSLVGRELPMILPFVRAIKIDIDGKNTRVWSGVAFKEVTDDIPIDLYTLDTERTEKNHIQGNRKILYNSIEEKNVLSVPPHSGNTLSNLVKRFGNTLTKPTLDHYFSEDEIKKLLEEGAVSEFKPGFFEVIKKRA